MLLGFGVMSIPVTLYSAELSDPTRPGWRPPQTETVAIKATPKLTAIMLRGTEKSALIGERYYRQGDVFQGKRIVRIEFDHIQLKTENGLEIMTLAPRVQLNRPTSHKNQQPQVNKTKATPQ